MKRIYQKPELEMITLVTTEKITNDDDDFKGEAIDGQMGLESSVF